MSSGDGWCLVSVVAKVEVSRPTRGKSAPPPRSTRHGRERCVASCPFRKVFRCGPLFQVVPIVVGTAILRRKRCRLRFAVRFRRCVPMFRSFLNSLRTKQTRHPTPPTTPPPPAHPKALGGYGGVGRREGSAGWGGGVYRWAPGSFQRSEHNKQLEPDTAQTMSSSPPSPLNSRSRCADVGFVSIGTRSKFIIVLKSVCTPNRAKTALPLCMIYGHWRPDRVRRSGRRHVSLHAVLRASAEQPRLVAADVGRIQTRRRGSRLDDRAADVIAHCLLGDSSSCVSLRRIGDSPKAGVLLRPAAVACRPARPEAPAGPAEHTAASCQRLCHRAGWQHAHSRSCHRGDWICTSCPQRIWTVGW
jgi:hypothetical protein